MIPVKSNGLRLEEPVCTVYSGRSTLQEPSVEVQVSVQRLADRSRFVHAGEAREGRIGSALCAGSMSASCNLAPPPPFSVERRAGWEVGPMLEGLALELGLG